MTTTSAPNALAMRGIDKSFPGVKALDAATLAVGEGEVHGLVGENGAGKSTIIKVLAGVYDREAGSIELDGVEVADITPELVRDRGVRFIHQEVSLVPHLTVAESVFLGQELRGPLGLRFAKMRSETEEFFSEVLRVELDGRTLVRDLTVAQRKLVQIARALIDGEARHVVFDEPTAVLGASDIEVLFRAIRSLRDRGISMLYVSHYLTEITDICDRVTVFRNGTDVGTLDIGHGAGDELEDEIIRLMVGHEIEQMYPDRTAAPQGAVLELRNASDGVSFRHVDLQVQAGEIVGIAGVIGSGREALIDAIYGLRPMKTGSVEVDGTVTSLGSPAAAVAAGIVLVPRDRRGDGLVLEMDVGDNIGLATLDDVAGPFGWLDRGEAEKRSSGLVQELDVRPGRTDLLVRNLSGGNQQKVVLARWLTTDARVFLLDDPTVGVDVGARGEIYRLVADLATQGAGVLVSSNDLTELIGLCDRIVVMLRGEIVTELPTDGLELDELVAATTGSGRGGQP